MVKPDGTCVMTESRCMLTGFNLAHIPVWNEIIRTFLLENSHSVPSISHLHLRISGLGWSSTYGWATFIPVHGIYLVAFGQSLAQISSGMEALHLAANETLCQHHSFPLSGLESSAVPSVQFPKGMQTYWHFL